MSEKRYTPAALYHLFRNNLGSIRRVYVRGNQITRRGDIGRHPETVLLLHGFMQTRNVWEVMEDRLRYDGYGVFSLDLGGFLSRFNSHPISFLAQAIAEKLEGICERYGLDRFHIVGHSKGGIIARHYVQHYGGDRRAKSLITLGAPHHGTPTASVGVLLMGAGLLSKSPLEMLPRSALIKLLKEDTFPSHIPLTSLYSRHDLVCPYWCSVLRPSQGETSMRNVAVRGVGHTALCHDAGVYRLLRAELERASSLWAERAEGLD